VTRIAFATAEFWPLTEGGAGRLNAQLVDLLAAAGHDAHVVLVAGDDVETDDPKVHIVHATDSAGWDLEFMAVSKAAAEGLSELHSVAPIDRIEIQDFDGLPFWTLTHRGDLGFAEIPITIRFHGPVDLQIEAMGVETPELAVAAQMERDSFSMADAVIVPGEGIAELVRDRYSIESARVVVGTPVVRDLPVKDADRTGAPRFTVIGRLSEVKGSHDMVTASIPLLRQFPDATVTFVGSDGWSATAHTAMRPWLSSMIPTDVVDRIVFVGHVDADELADIVARSSAVVAPSRFESFNLAIHEARRAGAPVVVPDIPAFSAMFSGQSGAEVYDGSVEGLTAALQRLSGDPERVRELSSEPAPALGDPLTPYEQDLPAVWHRRSQGGLATAALARVEEVRFAEPEVARHQRILKSVIRSAPAPLVGVALKVLPGRVRDRLRVASDWDWDKEEVYKKREQILQQVRQQKADRWGTVNSRISSGELGEIASPRVTIVIPCFNQGEFINDALLSIFEQTADDYDIVIVDDGSDDGTTSEILDSLHLPRVGVIHQENVGLPGARNRGIAVARGRYVVTLDADDELDPEYVEKLAAVLDDDDTKAFAHCWAHVFGDYEAIWATRPFNRYQILLSNSVVGCVMLRKTAWEAVGGYDETMHEGNEDWDLWIRLSEAGFGNGQITEPLFWYRKHGVTMSVDTEARYEAVLTSLSERLPSVYSIGHMQSVKQAAYPLLSILTDDDTFEAPFDDVQVLHTSHDRVDSVLDEVRGKYTVWLPSTGEATIAVLVELCEILEEEDAAGAAQSAESAPIRVVRTWSLQDPDGPSEVATSALPGTSEQRLSCGQFPGDSWQVPQEIGGIAVHRQRPEEAGLIPDWVDA
jgi:glycosyltransferase involved in cell wall biosynthesis